MFVYLDDIVGCMLSFRKEAYLDTNSGYCVYDVNGRDINDDTLIKIPKIDDDLIYLEFIKYFPSKSLQKKLATEAINADWRQMFHHSLYDSGLYDDWIQFVQTKEYEFARNWCEENQIRYTSKQKPLT